MTYETQMGALASQIAQLRDTMTQMAAEFHDLHSRFTQMEEGVVRHRDQLMQTLRAEALDKMHELESRAEALERAVVNMSNFGKAPPGNQANVMKDPSP